VVLYLFLDRDFVNCRPSISQLLIDLLLLELQSRSLLLKTSFFLC
jgi:hypothetical protein